MQNLINSNVNVKGEVLCALDKLHTMHKNWIKLKRMTEDKLYALMDGSLQLCYLAGSTEAHMAAFKECCGFKWGRKTKTSVLVAKAVFGADTKQVHNYAKALELAVAEKIGIDGQTDMATWLRVNGGISGITRGEDGGGKSSRGNVIELEHAHNVSVGRNADDYGSHANFRIALDKNYLDNLRGGDVILLCNIDRVNGELIIYWTDNDFDKIENYYACLGKQIKDGDGYTMNAYKKYMEKKEQEAIAGFEIQAKIREITERFIEEDTVAA